MFPARVGPQPAADGTLVWERAGRDGAIVGINGHGYYQEPVYRGNVYSMVMTASVGTIVAGNVVGASAAAATQFALFNPANSGKALVLLRLRIGIISGTPPAGPVFHGYIANVPTAAATGTILSNILGGAASSVAKGYSTPTTGTTLTGGLAPVTLMCTNFACTATVAAAPFTVATDDVLDGQIIIPQGTGWLPLWSGLGTTLLNSYSITWEEIPA